MRIFHTPYVPARRGQIGPDDRGVDAQDPGDLAPEVRVDEGDGALEDGSGLWLGW